MLIVSRWKILCNQIVKNVVRIIVCKSKPYYFSIYYVYQKDSFIIPNPYPNTHVSICISVLRIDIPVPLYQCSFGVLKEAWICIDIRRAYKWCVHSERMEISMDSSVVSFVSISLHIFVLFLFLFQTRYENERGQSFLEWTVLTNQSFHPICITSDRKSLYHLLTYKCCNDAFFSF